MDDMCRTQTDELRATWCLLHHHSIAIVAVENVSDATPVVCFGPENYPDLAQARELHPELARLWDAVRHEFWGKLFPPLQLGTEKRAWA